jgi:hypothetical protein
VEQALLSADRSCQDQDDAAAGRARACADARQSSNASCEIPSVCFAPYMADHPNGRARGEFDALTRQASRDCEAAGAVGRQAEDRLFEQALACAAASAGCGVPLCFEAYLGAYPAGRHVSRARAEIAAARCAPAASVPNGVYLARTQQGCNAGAQSVRITLADGRLAWQHDAQGTTFQWEGTLDRDGEVLAQVRGVTNMQAKGRWHDADRFIEMQYPQCGKVLMTIYQMLRQ